MKTKTAQSLRPQDGDEDIIELADYLTEVEFSDSYQEPSLQWQPEHGFSFRSSALTTPRDYKEILLERVKRSLLPVCVNWKRT
jgi:hypothetical protein